MKDNTAVDVSEIFERIQKLAEFARSVLHLPFQSLEDVNPSFGIMAKYLELVGLTLAREAHSGKEHAEYLSETMNDIAIAIVERDDKSITDSMCILDEFVEQIKAKMNLETV